MTDTVHIRLEIRPDGDCFMGRAISDEGSREFHGWMGLMGAIDALYPHSGTATPTVGTPPPGEQGLSARREGRSPGHAGRMPAS